MTPNDHASRTGYTGDDPLLRWYHDNGADWFDEARFDVGNHLNFLAWREVVRGIEHRVTLDRYRGDDSQDPLRLIVDLGDLVPIQTSVPTVQCAAGHERHIAGGFSHKGYFFMVGACMDRRLAVAATFFSEPPHHVLRARGLATQVVDIAAERGISPQTIFNAAASGFFVNCKDRPWR